MIVFNSLTDFVLKSKLFHKKWIKAVAEAEGYQVADISYIFCDDDYLLELNKKYLNHDTLTDIITFDYVEGTHLSGDIYISIERVRENANIFDQSFERELHRVLAHGVLHLCGYKDKSKNDSKLMRQKEEESIARYENMQFNCK